MKKLMIKKSIAIFLITIMTTMSMPLMVFGVDSSQYATRGQISDIVLMAASDYTDLTNKETVLIGNGNGDTRGNDNATRAETLVMLSRAFGQLPELGGHNKRVSVTDISFPDTPEWAKADISNLSKAGILIPSSNEGGLLNPNEYVTVDEVQTVISRIYSLMGSNVKDDFYATINKKALDDSSIRSGEMAFGTFADLNYKSSQDVSSIIGEITSNIYTKGTKEQKISDFYQSALDTEARNKQGIEPIAKYLDAISKAQNIEQLLKAESQIYEGTGIRILLGIGLMADSIDSNSHIMNIAGVSPMLPTEFYKNEDKSILNIYTKFLTNLLVLSKDSQQKAEEKVKLYLEMETKLAENMMNMQDYGDVDKIYNVYTVAEIQAIFPNVDIKNMITESGYQLPDKMLVTDVGLLKSYSEYFNDENIETLKASSYISLVYSFSSILGEDFKKEIDNFQREFYGVEGVKTAEEDAAMMTQSMMSDYIGEIYIDKYFSKEAKNDVESMVKDFIGVYKERIQKLDWMSETTKKSALKKLDTMVVKIGYPDSWETYMDQVDIKNTKDGGSLFENLCNIARQSNIELASLQGKPVDKSEWGMSAYTVNAYYNPAANEIVFPAGILQAPFYDVTKSKEENLGGVGFIIAHEITHSFDNNGAKYDENGNASNWWTEEDYSKFKELCDKAVEFYDQNESIPGIMNNGEMTLSENIADLGAMACVLETASKMENPDYEKLFENLANCWKSSATREYLSYVSTLDVHSADKLRVNRVIVNFDEFYRTYDVKEGDGMYLAPEDRMKIW